MPAAKALNILDRTIAPHLRSKIFGHGKKIGRGGMAKIYARHDAKNGLTVTKVARGNTPLHLFLINNERKILSQLRHPNIVEIKDTAETRGTNHLQMEYVKGKCVDEYIYPKNGSQRTLSIAEALEIAKQVAGALAHMHERGLVHADVKPSNILWRRKGKKHIVKLADFAFARPSGKLLDEFEDSKSILGTPEYVSLERARQKPPMPTDDIFSLGVTLFAMLKGDSPITQKNFIKDQRELADHIDASGLPRPIRELILRMTVVLRFGGYRHLALKDCRQVINNIERIQESLARPSVRQINIKIRSKAA